MFLQNAYTESLTPKDGFRWGPLKAEKTVGLVSWLNNLRDLLSHEATPRRCRV